MRTRPTPSPSEHQQAVARRLAELSRQLSRPPSEPPQPEEVEQPEEPDEPEGPAWWAEHTRSPAAPPPAPPALPVAAPVVPGRHVAAWGRPGLRERAAAGLVERLPDTLRGSAAFGPAQLAVVALVVALGLGVLAWWVVRGDATAPVPAAAAPLLPVSGSVAPVADGAPGSTPGGEPESGASAPPTTPATAPATAPATGRLVVDVAGRVRRPGIVVLPAGSRVIDAVRRAGGARPGVDLTPLNLARPLVDGEQILVGVAAATVPPTTPGTLGTTGTTGAPAGAPLDLNTATEAQLEALPDVGPVTAGSILSWRQEHGRFSAVGDLLEVDGIGPATLEKLTPLVTVS